MVVVDEKRVSDKAACSRTRSIRRKGVVGFEKGFGVREKVGSGRARKVV